ncbi:MAG: EAL domain-containing protein [Pseudomonadota bacterium]
MLAVCLCLLSPLPVWAFGWSSEALETPDKQNTWVIGVLAWRGTDKALAEWNPTLQYLNESLSGEKFILRPLMLREVGPALAEGQIDFLLSQPLLYVENAERYGLSQIATLRLLDGEYALDRFGATFFTRADRADIDSLDDLRHKRIAGVAADAFGGWLIGMRELKALDIDMKRDIQGLFTGLPQDQIVEAVLDKRADAGIVRTGLLEAMVREGRLSPDAVKILGGRRTPGFPFVHSTQLYPEWPLVMRKDIPADLGRRVSLALLSMPKDHPANRAAGAAGWSIPLDYTSIRSMMRELGLDPNAENDTRRFLALLYRYWPWFVLGALALFLALYLHGLRVNRRLAQARAALSNLLRAIDEAVVTTGPDGRIGYMNPAAEEITGLTRAQAEGQLFVRVFPLFADDATPGGRPVDSALSRALYSIAPEQVVQEEAWLRPVSGDEARFVRYSITALVGEEGRVEGAAISLHDLTDLRQLNEQLRYRATHDPLTGLVNRREFERVLESRVVDARETGGMHALLFLDLDGFKVVNDSGMHAAGDEVLRRLAGLFGVLCPPYSVIGRIGGDEFAVLVEGMDVELAQELAEDMVAAVRDFRLDWEGRFYQVGLSVGIAPVDAATGTAADALNAVDSACFLAKSHGGNRAHVHQPDDEEVRRHHESLGWLQRLREALAQDRFVLFAQRVAPLAGLDARGALLDEAQEGHFEILVRLEEGGQLLMPGSFIPAAERFRLMPEIDRWIVRHLFRKIAREEARGFSFSINLSAETIQDPDIELFILTEARLNGIDPHLICIEVTETAAIHNLEPVAERIQNLRRHGFRFSLDDFGNGLLSFNFLRRLNVDQIKIDGNLIKDIERDAVAAVMVESIHRVGALMGASTVAEWVEDADTLERLRGIGVTHVQGWLVHRPEPLDAMLDATVPA